MPSERRHSRCTSRRVSGRRRSGRSCRRGRLYLVDAAFAGRISERSLLAGEIGQDGDRGRDHDVSAPTGASSSPSIARADRRRAARCRRRRMDRPRRRVLRRGLRVLVASLCLFSLVLRRQDRARSTGRLAAGVAARLPLRALSSRPQRVLDGRDRSATFILISVDAFRRGEKRGIRATTRVSAGTASSSKRSFRSSEDMNGRSGREALNLSTSTRR